MSLSDAFVGQGLCLVEAAWEKGTQLHPRFPTISSKSHGPRKRKCDSPDVIGLCLTPALCQHGQWLGVMGVEVQQYLEDYKFPFYGTEDVFLNRI